MCVAGVEEQQQQQQKEFSTEQNSNRRGSLVCHQDVCEVPSSSTVGATAELFYQLWELWKGAGVADGIQPLAQFKVNP